MSRVVARSDQSLADIKMHEVEISAPSKSLFSLALSQRFAPCDTVAETPVPDPAAAALQFATVTS